jgi:hypothetical protein
LSTGHDERCAADLALVIEGRKLAVGDADRLIRAVTGAVRPNRDKPFWDMAHAFVAIVAMQGSKATDPLGLVMDLALNPGLAAPNALCKRLVTDFGQGSDAVVLSADGLTLRLPDVSWRIGWPGLARSLALAEFLMTCDDLEHFGSIKALLAEAGLNLDRDALTRRLVQIINSYRLAHMPAAAFERRFRSILSYLGGAGDGTAVTDAAIAGFWRHEIAEHERPHFRTVAEHFATFVKLTAVLRSLSQVRGAGSLEDIASWQDRLDDMLADVACDEEATSLIATRLAQFPDTPKILTGAERDDLIAILSLDRFHHSLPRTVLRAVSFGLVQSGIANRLRRGSGGASVTERVTCDDAERYVDILARLRTIQDHLQRMLKIAVALRMQGIEAQDEQIATLLQSAEADIRRIRRAGFEQEREQLAAAFAGVDATLAETAVETRAFIDATGKLGGANTLSRLHAEDCVFFAEGLTAAYAQENSDGDRARHPA